MKKLTWFTLLSAVSAQYYKPRYTDILSEIVTYKIEVHFMIAVYKLIYIKN